MSEEPRIGSYSDDPDPDAELIKARENAEKYADMYFDTKADLSRVTKELKSCNRCFVMQQNANIDLVRQLDEARNQLAIQDELLYSEKQKLNELRRSNCEWEEAWSKKNNEISKLRAELENWKECNLYPHSYREVVEKVVNLEKKNAILIAACKKAIIHFGCDPCHLTEAIDAAMKENV